MVVVVPFTLIFADDVQTMRHVEYSIPPLDLRSVGMAWAAPRPGHRQPRPPREAVATEDQDAALLANADALQRDADAVLVDLDLLGVLSGAGAVTRTGSSVHGLMVARDIDLYVVRDVWTPERCWQALAPVFFHDRMQSIRLSKWLGAYRDASLPEGYSAVLRYRPGPGAAGQWRIDVWFFTHPEADAKLHWHRRIRAELRLEVRLAILRVKAAVHAEPWYSSAEVYEAVLEYGVRNPQDFWRYRAQRRAAASEG